MMVSCSPCNMCANIQEVRASWNVNGMLLHAPTQCCKDKKALLCQDLLLAAVQHNLFDICSPKCAKSWQAS